MSTPGLDPEPRSHQEMLSNDLQLLRKGGSIEMWKGKHKKLISGGDGNNVWWSRQYQESTPHPALPHAARLAQEKRCHSVLWYPGWTGFYAPCP